MISGSRLTFVSQTGWTGLDSGAPVGYVRGRDMQEYHEAALSGRSPLDSQADSAGSIPVTRSTTKTQVGGYVPRPGSRTRGMDPPPDPALECAAPSSAANRVCRDAGVIGGAANPGSSGSVRASGSEMGAMGPFILPAAIMLPDNRISCRTSDGAANCVTYG